MEEAVITVAGAIVAVLAAATYALMIWASAHRS
ncbi:hypothetical protein BDZ31_001127 [Conexibacter arvalis]|uniref:Uncharacterized protein n=1 Tax=Conexibacter arvalis TaxID=912552 RepID=A0A840IBS6_9ACTN|nr:hypothetical protein [Conexibacter arvalis]